MGTVAHDKRNCAKLVELEAHTVIGRVLDLSTDEESKCMAVRAIKNLADRKEHVASLGRLHVLPKLWTLLTTTSSDNTVKILLSALHHITSYLPRFSEGHAHYWLSNEGGGRYIARYENFRTIKERKQIQILVKKKKLRLVELCPQADVGPKSLQLLGRIVNDPHLRRKLADRQAFASLIPAVSESAPDNPCKTFSIIKTKLII